MSQDRGLLWMCGLNALRTCHQSYNTEPCLCKSRDEDPKLHEQIAVFLVGMGLNGNYSKCPLSGMCYLLQSRYNFSAVFNQLYVTNPQ